MTWHEDPRWLRSIIGALLAVVVALVGLRVTASNNPASSRPTPTVEVGSEACMRAAGAGKQVAKAAGAALYVASDVSPLVRNALAAGDDQAKVDNVLNHLRALAPSLRRARSFNESGDPPAWWRFHKWSARCLGEPEISASYDPPVGNEDDLRRTVRRFMGARLRGSGAERFLAAEGRDEFRAGGTLAPMYPQPPLQEFDIVFVDGPLGGPHYEVGVELVFARGSYGDTLFVSFKGDRYAITGGRPGLKGP
jgi:hypothetical protein